MMTIPANTSVSYLRRTAEHERLVRELVDRTAFGPVAISTALSTAQKSAGVSAAALTGFGKTTLAQAVADDPRVLEAFPDGVFWVSLAGRTAAGDPAGAALAPLSEMERMGRMDQLIAGITGAPSGLTDAAVMESSLHAALHPLRALLVIDDVYSAEALQPFLHSGPGGATLIVAYEDSALPFEARRVAVDDFTEEEELDVLLTGIPLAESVFSAADAPTEPPAKPGMQAGLETPATDGSPADTVLANRQTMRHVEHLEHRMRLVEKGIAPETAAALQSLCSRLIGWPVLVMLANGLLASIAEQQPDLALNDLLRAVDERLERRGLSRDWQIEDLSARLPSARAAVDALMDTLLPEERERCAELAVFPAGDWVPRAAAEALWGKGSAEGLLAKLASRRLIELDSTQQIFSVHPILSECFAARLEAGGLALLHNRLVSAYQAKSAQGFAGVPEDGYIFQHLPAHLLAAGQRLELQQLLFDFDWLAAYIYSREINKKHADFYALVRMFDLALSATLDRRMAGLRMVREAVRLAIPNLARDPDQFATQMLGRLLSFADPQIQSMLARASEWHQHAWMRPMTVCFAPPGGEELRVLQGHRNWVTGVALLPDRQFAVSGSLDGTLRLWNLSIGQQVYAVEAHPGGVLSVAVTPDGQRAVTGGSDGRVKLWELEHGHAVMTLEAHADAVGALAITPDGSLLITAGDDKLIRLWEMENGQPVTSLMGHTEPVRSLAITPDGRTLISGGMDDALRIWDLDNGRQIHQLAGHTSWVRTITTTPDGYYVISAGWDRTLRVWDMFTGEEVLNIDVFATPVFSIAVTGDGQAEAKNLLVLCGTGDGTLRILDFYSGEEVIRLSGHTGGINTLAVSSDGLFAVTGSDDGTLRVWDLQSTRRLGAHNGPQADAPVPLLIRLPGGKRALSGAADGTLKIWELATGAEVRALTGHSGGVPVVAVDEAGRRAVTGAPDQSVRVWDLESGSTLHMFDGHHSAITAVAITPDGASAVSGDLTGKLCVWDIDAPHGEEPPQPAAVFQGEGAIMGCQIDAAARTVAISEAGGKMYFLEIKRK